MSTVSLPRGFAINRKVSVIAGAVALAGTVLLAAILLPGLEGLLERLPASSTLGLVLLLSSAVRLLAGVLGARAMRREQGLDTRTAALASVLVGVAAGWLIYALLILLGGGASPFRLLLELVRWWAESAFGAYLVNPGDRDAWDPHRRLVAARQAIRQRPQRPGRRLR